VVVLDAKPVSSELRSTIMIRFNEYTFLLLPQTTNVADELEV
jgi:hypothetical protein